jgi:hypothetical protein
MDGVKVGVGETFRSPAARETHVEQRGAAREVVPGAKHAEVLLERACERVELVARGGVGFARAKHVGRLPRERRAHPGERGGACRERRGVGSTEHVPLGGRAALLRQIAGALIVELEELQIARTLAEVTAEAAQPRAEFQRLRGDRKVACLVRRHHRALFRSLAAGARDLARFREAGSTSETWHA